ncbi:MFS transporter [Gorillibacterium sp. sgz5001074]|uniref:MFS transporter n=1 Tax=Gorillibacterium sp. sgz5001074 TaxID=3446695 RepID=UPI003F6636FF
MNKRWAVYAVSLAAFLGPFTQTIYTPLLPEVTDALHTTPFLVNVSISIFTVGLALMQLVYGPLTDTRGRRKVLLAGISIYILASLGCYFSGGIAGILVFRSLQAIGIAAGSVVAVTVIGDLYDGPARGKAMGTFQMMVYLGPVGGPIIGGLLGGRFDFHTVFLALTGAGLLILAGNAILLKETKPATGSGRRFSPADYAAVLKDRVGSAIILLGFVQYYVFYNFLVFVPGILTDRYGLSPEQKGLALLPMSAMIVAGSYIGGRLQLRLDGRRLVTAVSFLNLLAVALFLLLYPLSLGALLGGTLFIGLFLGVSLPVQTTLLTEEFVETRATATGMYNLFRYLGMACGPVLGSFLLSAGGYGLLFGFAAAGLLGCALFMRGRLGEGRRRFS